MQRWPKTLALCAVVAGVVLVPSAIAVHDEGLFELDGNAVDAAPAGQDWDTVSKPPAIDSVFVTDAFDSATDNVYTGGGSKDDLDVPSWKWKDAQPSPDKDDLEHAYAAAYSKDGQLYLYFGADRFAVDGSANVGFWFLQDAVAPIAGGTFSGTHQDGDVFVASEFTNGGAIPHIVVYRWQSGALVKVGENDPSTTGASCDAADAICAVVNSSDEATPWLYVPKGSSSDGDFPAGAFFEGGINLTALFPTLPCISSFIASTRTSFEPNSQLKDFAFGSIDVCSGIVVEKQTLPDGAPETFTFTGNASGTISDGGTISVTRLQAGTYTSTENDPGSNWSLKTIVCDDSDSSGDVATRTATFRVTAGETVKCVFTNEKKATKSGTKFHDLDADGSRDAGEPGLGGWSFYVDYDNDSTHDAGEPNTTSGSDGTYQITGINPGTWTVREVAQAGWLCSAPSPCTYTETFAPGEAEIGNDFGNYQNSSGTGLKFHDLDGDGSRDAAEPGLSGWTFYVDYDNDSTHDTGEPSATSGTGGTFTITGVKPGTWNVREVGQSGWVCSAPAGCSYTSAFVSGGTLSNLVFGNYRRAAVGGVKVHDLDADGARDAGEPGLSGWTFYVDYDNDGTRDLGEPSATSASDGIYQISGINPGSWTVREVGQSGWTCSFPATCAYTVTLASGGASTQRDFGNWTTANVSGIKFHDLNANGQRDGGEPGLAGWTFYVDYDNDSTHDAGESSATSGSDGTYQISGVNPGSWTVREVAQAGWTCSFPSNCRYTVTLSSAESATGRDFGNYRRASVGGTKFHDLDADGSRDTAEPGLAGWTFYVDYDNDSTHDAGEPSATSGADGSYQISGVNPGSWTLREVGQSGWTCSFPTDCRYAVSLSSGDSATGKDFGNYRRASVGGTKFHDLDADGSRDAAEPGLAGWTFYVDYDNDSTHDAGEPSATSGSDGTYQIGGVNPGTWTVRELGQPGWTCSFPTGCSHTVGFVSGQSAIGMDFGNYRQGTVSGSKFDDADADGTRDPADTGLGDWTIRAYVDANGNGTLQATETVIAASATTAADGTYELTLGPGAYVVCEVLQPGWVQSAPANELCAAASEVATGGRALVLTSGSSTSGLLFGNYRRASVSGLKSHDLDADGTRDPGEAGLSDWTFYVDYDNDSTHDAGEPSATSGSDGTYQISGVNPGSWTLREVGQSGWTCSAPAACTYAVALSSGESATGRDFGNWTSASVSGSKFHDQNGNGQHDGGEPGLGGWTFYVDYDNDSTHDAGEPSATSGADGSYQISGVNPGSWTLREVGQSGWTCSVPDNCGYPVNLSSAESATGKDFGNFRQGSASGSKFEDGDADGTRDPGEPGLSGWTIRAYVDANSDGALQASETTVAASATTATVGTYELTLDPGTYVVCEVLQTGWTQSAPANGLCAAVSGLATGGRTLVVTSGSSASGLDFGNWTSGAKTGAKFGDLDADGVRDEGEPGLSGWTFFVDYDDDASLDAGEPNAISGADGSYSLAGIKPGTWKIREVAQSGWTCSFPTPCFYEETFSSGTRSTGNDFGNYRRGTSAGVKFEDLDADGVRDAAEPTLAGWTIRAYVDANGDGTLQASETTVAASATTGETGSFAIELVPGSYVLCEVLQAGWTQSKPANAICDAVDGVAPGGYAITVTSGSEAAGSDFGNFRAASATGVKFNDANANAARDAGEAGLSGWTIRAYADRNSDGTLQVSETSVAASASTASDGTYELTLDPGSYVLCEVPQTGWSQSSPGGNTRCAAIGGLAPAGHALIVASSGTASGKDFGNFVPTTPPPPAPPPPPTPTPPPPAPKTVDLAITKSDLRDPVVVGESITYSVVVANTGPDAATGVKVTDVLPVDLVAFASATFVRPGGTTGACSYASPIVTCDLGALAVGQSATITIVVTAQVAGTALNEAIVVGNEAEPNTANNRDTEETLIEGPFTPPSVCATLRLSTRVLTVGKKVRVVATVRDQRGRRMPGVRINVRGPGVRQSKRTNRRGTATFVINPRSPGIVSFAVPGRRTCARRVGVLGVFQPPLSG